MKSSLIEVILSHLKHMCQQKVLCGDHPQKYTFFHLLLQLCDHLLQLAFYTLQDYTHQVYGKVIKFAFDQNQDYFSF